MNKERILLFILAAAMFTHIMDFMIIMPLGTQLMSIFNISPQQFSLLVASYTITAGISGFFAAFFIDRFDRKAALIFMYTGFAIGTLACAFAPTYGILLATRSLTGGFGGILGALILSIVSDVVPLERRARGIGTIMASFGFASVAGVPFGLYLASKTSWHAPFLFLGIVSVVIDVLIFTYVESMTHHLKEKHESPLEVMRKIFGNPNARTGLVFTSLMMLGHFTVIPFVAPYMEGNVGFSKEQIALIYLFGGGFTLFTSRWVGKLADKHGRLKIYTIFGTLVLIPVLIVTNLTPVPVSVALVVTTLFFILSNGRMVPATTMETSIIRPENRGSYMSIRSSVQHITSGIASFIGGLIIVERPPIFGTAKALDNYFYVGLIAIGFSVVSLFVARRLTAVQGA